MKAAIERLHLGWQKDFLFYEACAGWLVSLALILIAEWQLGYGHIAEATQRAGNLFLGTMAGILAGLLGFAITTMSIVAGLVYGEKFDLLRSSKPFGQVWQIFSSTIAWCTATLAVTLVGFFPSSTGNAFSIIVLAMVPFTVMTGLRFWRCVWLLRHILQIASQVDSPEVTAAKANPWAKGNQPPSPPASEPPLV